MNPQLMVMFGIFFFCLGACVGSFLNVVIWRLPNRGREVLFLGKTGNLTLSWPPSHCPVCDSAIAWYQNIPVFAWLYLRGKCAQCRTGIPIRYPLVELGTGVLFLGFYMAYFVAGWQPGVGPAGGADIRTDWPVLIFHLLFASALLAGSAIDADLFIIPLSICWFLAVLGLAGSAVIGPPLTTAYAIIPSLTRLAGGPEGWAMAKPVMGGIAGLVLANVLMYLKLMPRSFDGPEWDRQVPDASEKTAQKDSATGAEGKKVRTQANETSRESGSPLPPPPKLTRFGLTAGAAVILVILMIGLWFLVSARVATLAGIGAGILIFLLGVLPRDAGQTDVTDDVLEEIANPHVRREMFKELLFLAMPVAGAILAYGIPGQVPTLPWADRLLGSLLGLLAGGGMVWVLRVMGSLAFGREAMGMGDAHLMAGVGAVLGAKLVILAFFAAPFLGLLWAIVLKILGKPNVLPYGPWLSVASILVLLLGNPALAAWLQIMQPPPPLPPAMPW
jgi:prepilin signal peptidase PulO-like enzyme (type II secretory pathway)